MAGATRSRSSWSFSSLCCFRTDSVHAVRANMYLSLSDSWYPVSSHTLRIDLRCAARAEVWKKVGGGAVRARMIIRRAGLVARRFIPAALEEDSQSPSRGPALAPLIASRRLRSVFLFEVMSPRRLKKQPGASDVEGSPANPEPIRSSGSMSERCSRVLGRVSPGDDWDGDALGDGTGPAAAAAAVACSISCWMPTSCARGAVTAQISAASTSVVAGSSSQATQAGSRPSATRGWLAVMYFARGGGSGREDIALGKSTLWFLWLAAPSPQNVRAARTLLGLGSVLLWAGVRLSARGWSSPERLAGVYAAEGEGIWRTAASSMSSLPREPGVVLDLGSADAERASTEESFTCRRPVRRRSYESSCQTSTALTRGNQPLLESGPRIALAHASGASSHAQVDWCDELEAPEIVTGNTRTTIGSWQRIASPSGGKQADACRRTRTIFVGVPLRKVKPVGVKVPFSAPFRSPRGRPAIGCESIGVDAALEMSCTFTSLVACPDRRRGRRWIRPFLRTADRPAPRP